MQQPFHEDVKMVVGSILISLYSYQVQNWWKTCLIVAGSEEPKVSTNRERMVGRVKEVDVVVS
jgi:hypothetical protein